MALTRSLMKGMGFTEEQISAVIDAHMETVNGLKADVEKYKTEAEKVAEIRKELDKANETIKNNSSDEWKNKYEKEHADFEAFKTEQSKAATNAKRKNLLEALLKEIGVAESAIPAVLKTTNLDTVEIDDKDALKDKEKLTETLKTEWSGFITTEERGGAGTEKGGGSGGGVDLDKLSMADYIAARKKM